MVLVTWLISLSELYNSADVANRKDEVETFNKVSHNNIFWLGSSVHWWLISRGYKYHVLGLLLPLIVVIVWLKANRWRKRGLTVSPVRFGLVYGSPYTVFVSIYFVDGTVAIAHGGVEIGQGINTKVRIGILVRSSH